jgi:hypothetical protein
LPPERHRLSLSEAVAPRQKKGNEQRKRIEQFFHEQLGKVYC